MKVERPGPEGLILITPRVFGDSRGCFLETFQRQRYADIGIACDFVQDNISQSKRGVLRGLHFQVRTPQDKLVQAMSGEILDVAVDLRAGSPTFGQSYTAQLSGENKQQLFVPKGFAHGFLVLSAEAVVGYKCSAYYDPKDEGGVRWNDPDLHIEWRCEIEPIVSAKDANLPLLRDIPQSQLWPWKPREERAE